MEIKSISIQLNVWEQALKKARANAQSLSPVIQRLLELWLNDDIDLTQGQKKK